MYAMLYGSIVEEVLLMVLGIEIKLICEDIAIWINFRVKKKNEQSRV